MGKSKKGPQYERDISRALSKWWTNNKRDDVFWRTSQSGGRATQRRKSKIATSNSSGDVGYLDVIGKPLIDKCLIELKRGYTNDITVLDLVDGKKKSFLIDVWEKAEKERQEAGREYTWIIFKRDRHIESIMISWILFSDITKKYSMFEKNHVVLELNETMEYCLIVMRLDDFLDWVKPEFFK